MIETKVSVLIVGAGPVGLTMACELARRGVAFRIIDKSLVATDKSKALGVHSRTLEILETMGLVQNFLNTGHLVYGTTFWHKDKKLMHLSLEEIDGPYPYVMMIPQSETERLLTEKLNSYKISIERGTELSTFVQNNDCVKSIVKHSDGTEESITSNWIIGCDGAHSTVRHTLGLTFEGEQYAEGFATFDVHVAWDMADDNLNIFVADDGMMACFPMGNKHYRIIADEPVAQHKTGDPITLADAQKLVDERGPKGVVLSDPVWMTYFTINRRSTNQYRTGRAFVVGDAAHIHSPALGQGMNTGMQDAFNLAWKLDLVEKGVANEKLLDSFEQERHPVGKELLKMTDAATKLMTLRSPISQETRNRLMPLVSSTEVFQHRAVKTLSMLGVNYRHSPIVSEYKASAFSNAEGEHTGVLTNLGAWLDFEHGPEPGDRAPDGYVLDSVDGESMRLFPMIANISHNLLLFAGLKATPACYDTMNKAAAAIKEGFGEYVKVHFVVCGETKPEKLAEGFDILFDTDESFHHIYGAVSQCSYLIRPDGYIGQRSHPIDTKHLVAHLQSIFSQIKTVQKSGI